METLQSERKIESNIEDILWSTASKENDYWINDSWVYAVLDCAQNSDIFSSFKNCFTRYESLYEGNMHRSLQEAVPHLVRLRKGTPYTEWLLQNCVSKNWGIFFTSKQEFSDIRRHLRRFLRVKTEEGKILLFRWYDPRVLRVYLPTCTFEELTFIFGSIETFFVESESSTSIYEFSIKESALDCKEHALSQTILNQ